jgi:O-antigen/teichoic acid export membrane protein
MEINKILIRKIQEIKVRLSIDDIVFYTLLSRFWTLISGVLTLGLITYFLTPTEQGFYFTLFSLISIQILFELGLTYTLTQFIAHEMADLKLLPNYIIIGNLNSKGRILAVIKIAIKWYLAAASIFAAITVLAGYIIFSKSNLDIISSWIYPLVGISIASGIKLLLTSFEALLEGVGLASIVSKTRLFSAIIGSFSLWGTFLYGEGLYAPVMMIIGVLIFAIVRYWIIFSEFIIDIVHHKNIEIIFDWKQEIWPLQWRMAISWASGYFIYQLFNPVIFYYTDAVSAGKFGLAMTITGVIMSICSAWISPKVAIISTFTAKNENTILLKNFKNIMKITLIVALTLSLICILLYWLAIQYNLDVVLRLPDIFIVTGLLCGVVLNQIIAVIALFVRARKIDPYVISSVLSAVITILLLLICVPKFGLYGAITAYLVPPIFIGIPISLYFYFIYLNFKDKYVN